MIRWVQCSTMSFVTESQQVKKKKEFLQNINLKPLKMFIDVAHKNIRLKKQPTKGGYVLTKRIDWNVLLKMETDNLR